MTAPCQVSFGLISDIQYADTDNGHNFARTKVRYYRGSLQHLRRAVDHWSVHPPDFVLQLGDIIDGINSRLGIPGASQDALLKVLEEFSRLPRDVTVHHLVGNHELYNFSKQAVRNSPLNTSTLANVHRNSRDPEGMYYHFLATTGLRIVVLDTYDVSVLGFDKESEAYKSAYKFLRSINHNKDVNSGDGLPLKYQHLVAYNGAVSSTQLEWLDKILSDADQREENIIIVGHQGVSVEASGHSSVCWNYSEVMDVISRHNGCVVAHISGHSHWTAYAESHNVPFICLHGVIETPHDKDVYATAHVYSDRVQIDGFGCVPSYTLPLRYKIS